MKKSFKLLSLFSVALTGLTLASCMISINPGQTTTTTTAPAQTTTTTTAVVTDTEVATTPVEGGKYMLNNVVYEFDKTNKKIKATRYETYAEYTGNTGTVVIDNVSVKFVEYPVGAGGSEVDGGAVKFTVGNKNYYIYKTTAGKTRIDDRTATGSWSGHGFTPLADLVQPTYGTFVSEKFTQDKVDAQGKRIPADDGGYQKEDFYMFIELTATSAKVFVSDNNTTHGETPLYAKDNYDLLLQHARLFIRIPHNTEANYNCSIEFEDDTTIRVTNSYEKPGDYSCDGRFTKVE